MERKLTLADIACYLPYGLNFYSESVWDYPFPAIGFQKESIITYRNRYDHEDGRFYLDIERYRLKPVLRLQSDLYRTISHNGMEIVPIVELAKVGTKLNNGWGLDSKYNNCACNQRTGLLFGYDNEGFMTLPEQYQIYSQYRLFDYMNELKLDYPGLIDAKLAVSCYDLPENPYK